MQESGTYEGKVIIQIDIPPDTANKTIHIICEVSDSGKRALTSYRRVIVTSKN